MAHGLEFVAINTIILVGLCPGLRLKIYRLKLKTLGIKNLKLASSDQNPKGQTGEYRCTHL